MNLNLTAFPQVLKQTGRFCCWRYEERNGRRTKVPYQPDTGFGAKSNDPNSFVSYQTAIQANGYDGIGIGIFDGICAIDLDDCVSDEGCVTKEAAEIVELMQSYTEYSPSRHGLHILFRADGFQYDSSRYYIMNRNRHMEVYVAGATNKYVTVTGDRANAFEFGERSGELQAVLDRYMKRPEQIAQTRPAENCAGNAINAGKELTEDEIIRMAMGSRNGDAFARLWNGDIQGYPSPSEADMALCSHFAFWTGRDAAKMDSLFRKSGLMRDKWNRTQSGSTYGALTIRKAIAACANVYTPHPEITIKTVQGQKTEQGTRPAPATEKSEPPEPLFQPIKPLKPQNSELPFFPVECLPTVLRDYVQAVADHSQTAPDMAAVIGLGVLAVCLQGKYLVEGMPGYTEPLSLYTVVIAAPGERKSSVMRDMTRYIYDYEKEFNEEREPEIRSNRQERESLEREITSLQKKLEHKQDHMTELELQHLQDQLADLPEVKPVRFYADDCSSEALTSLLANNGGRLAVISTEGGIFDIMAGRYSNKVNIDVWLKGHCGDAIRVDRMGRDAEYIPHPALSAILSIQPSVLDEIMANATMTGRGLIARFLYASPQSRIGKRVFFAPAIPPEVEAAYRSMIFQLMAQPTTGEPVTLRLTEPATKMISDCFLKHEHFLVGEGQEISDWANKYIGTVLRIAGLLHAAEAGSGQSEISTATMQNAIQIGRYFLAHARYAYSMMGTDLTIQKAIFVVAKIRKKGAPEIKRSELFQMCRGKFFKKTEELFPILDLLEARGYIRMEQPRTSAAGRPPDVRVILNPEAPAV